MTPMQWAVEPLRKYASFSGRASRAEFWWFFLFANFLSLLAMGCDYAFELGSVVGTYGPINLIACAGLLVPLLAVQVRRVQDTKRPGLYVLLFYVPYVALQVGQARYWYDPMMRGGMDLGTSMIIGGLCMTLGIMLLVWSLQEGTRGDNLYGPDPVQRGLVA